MLKKISSALGLAPKIEYNEVSDGTKIYNYQEKSVEDVLKDHTDHRRILDDWERNIPPRLEKFSCCSLEISKFLTLPHRTYNFNLEDHAILSSPLPKVTTDEEFQHWFLLGLNFSTAGFLEILSVIHC